jgi:glutaminyl-tRNA synthetase
VPSPSNAQTASGEHSTPRPLQDPGRQDFIRQIVRDDLAAGLSAPKTRFPPEPNGYLHIGHCKALVVDFGMAEKYGGTTNLRYDDTNPVKEDTEYVDAIKEDIHWLGFQYANEFYASDYFEALYEMAVKLIKKGKAYMDELTAEEMRDYRGTLERILPGGIAP